MQEVAEDILVSTEYYGANVGCIVTYEGAILVDAPIIPSQAKHWRKSLEESTGADFLYIFSTDNHAHHCVGNNHFNPAAPIANERAYRGMSRFTPTMRERVLDIFRDWAPDVVTELADFQVAAPELTFDKDLTLYRGERVLHMIHTGGHSPAASILFVEDSAVLFAGDVIVVGRPPFIGQGDSLQWLEALRFIRQELKPKVIIPGHGPVCGPEAIDRQEDFLLRLRKRVASLVEEGRSKAEVATRMLSMLDEFNLEEKWRKRMEKSFRASVSRVYEEMKPTGQTEAEE